MKEYRAKPDSRLNLDMCDSDDTGEYKKTDQGKEKAKAITLQLIGRLEETSPGASNAGKSRNARSRADESADSKHSNREAARSGKGCWAIRAEGKS